MATNTRLFGRALVGTTVKGTGIHSYGRALLWWLQSSHRAPARRCRSHSGRPRHRRRPLAWVSGEVHGLWELHLAPPSRSRRETNVRPTYGAKTCNTSGRRAARHAKQTKNHYSGLPVATTATTVAAASGAGTHPRPPPPSHRLPPALLSRSPSPQNRAVARRMHAHKVGRGRARRRGAGREHPKCTVRVRRGGGHRRARGGWPRGRHAPPCPRAGAPRAARATAPRRRQRADARRGSARVTVTQPGAPVGRDAAPPQGEGGPRSHRPLRPCTTAASARARLLRPSWHGRQTPPPASLPSVGARGLRLIRTAPPKSAQTPSQRGPREHRGV